MKYSDPWEHYMEDNFLPTDILEELKNIKIDSNNAFVSGTRTGIPGRHFFTPEKNDDITKKLINNIIGRTKEFQDKFGYDLSDSYLRVELAQDDEQQWIVPHLDVLDKRITMIVYIDHDDNNTTNLGTDLYASEDDSVYVRAEWKNNRCLVFKPTEEKWHGIKERSYKGRRLVLLINYVSKKSWKSLDQIWEIDA
jgi:hypothetical protein|tara:strand:+ start:132 stop:716 length:585 start_codon:yes stop_codon:yes gene_type:complete